MGCAAGQGITLYTSRRRLRAWRRVRQRGAQLDGAFAFYSSRRQLRARTRGGGRTGSLLSTPPAIDFGLGSEGAAAGSAAGDISFYASRRRLWAWPGRGAAEGRAAGRGVCRLCLSPPTSGLAWMGRWRGALPGPGVLLFYLSLTGLSMRGPAMLGYWSQHHLTL